MFNFWILKGRGSWNKTQDKKSIIQIKALYGYFTAYPTAETGDIKSTEINHLELVNHKSWMKVYEKISKDTDTHKNKLVVLATQGYG